MEEAEVSIKVPIFEVMVAVVVTTMLLFFLKQELLISLELAAEAEHQALVEQLEAVVVELLYVELQVLSIC